MTTNANPTTDSQIILAGAAAEGHGALAGWRGAGPLTRGELAAALAEAGLPEDWAPAGKSDVGHAGEVLARVPGGYITRRAGAAPWSREGDGARVRTYRARWVVARSRAAVSEVGEHLGEVALVAELRDGSDALDVRTDGSAAAEEIATRIRLDYAAARASESYSSGDVTEWLRRTLVDRCGAARFGSCLYVPRAGRDEAARLARAVSSRWGHDWISPLLPVASSAELAEGLGRGLLADAEALWSELATRREDARRRSGEERTEVSPTVAARLLRECADLLSRVDRIESLAGAQAAPARARVAELRALLEPLADAGVQRMALLELDAEPAAPAAPARRLVSPTRAADEALDRRRAVREAPATPAVEFERPLELDLPAIEPEETRLPEGWRPPGLAVARDEYVRQLDLD